MKIPRALSCVLLSSLLIFFAGAPRAIEAGAFRKVEARSNPQTPAHDLEAASLFAPIFYQALGDKPRSDYITNFDFDGDWRGDNNWQNLENLQFPLKAFVYYSVSETTTHLFIHYAVFHPRDYKGGEQKGAILSELMREGVKRGGKYDPTGLAEETSLAHENDLEGCLIVVAKNGGELKRSHVVFVETLRHNLFKKYIPTESNEFEALKSEDQHVLLYVEPKGHGIEAYSGSEKQTAHKQFIVYKFAGKAEEPKENQEGSVGYELVPLQSTLWSRARNAKKSNPKEGFNPTYGATHAYGFVTIRMTQPNGRTSEKKINLGKVGSAFLGGVGGRNMARPPWAWSDRNQRDEPAGLWFFDPATIVKRDFKLDDSFSVAYVRLPFWAVRL